MQLNGVIKPGLGAEEPSPPVDRPVAPVLSVGAHTANPSVAGRFLLRKD